MLKSKFQNVLELCDNMTRTLQNKSPDCEEILKKKDFCSLDQKDLRFDEELKKLIASKLIEYSLTIFSLINPKLLKKE